MILRSVIFIPFLFLCPINAHISGPSMREEMMITDHEAEEFDKFKNAVSPLAPNNWMKTDNGLMKYFANSGRNAEAATLLFKEGLKLRLDSDSYKLNDEIRDFGKSVVSHEEHFDKFGRLVFFFKLKNFNMPLLMTNDTAWKIELQYLWGLYEQGLGKVMENSKKKAFGIALVTDCKDVKPEDVACPKIVKIFTEISKEFNARFPGSIQISFHVNVNPALELSASILKNLGSEYAKSVTQLHGEDDTVWAPLLAQFVDPASLPNLYQRSKESAGSPPAPGAAVGASPPGIGFGMIHSLKGGVVPQSGATAEKSEDNSVQGRGMKKKKGKTAAKKKKQDDDDYDNE